MPQKDTALTLAQAARSFIASCNAVLASGQAEGASCSGRAVAAAGAGGAGAVGEAGSWAEAGARTGADLQAGEAGLRAGEAGSRAGSAFLIPRFPLFAFADALPDGGFCACRILAPEREGREFFFPVELETRSAEGDGKHTLRLRIVFAELEGGTAGRAAPACGDAAGQTVCSTSDGTSTERQPLLPELPQEYAYRECFPLRPRVFRTGRVEYSGCSWEVWDERWQKLLP